MKNKGKKKKRINGELIHERCEGETKGERKERKIYEEKKNKERKKERMNGKIKKEKEKKTIQGTFSFLSTTHERRREERLKRNDHLAITSH